MKIDKKKDSINASKVPVYQKFKRRQIVRGRKNWRRQRIPHIGCLRKEARIILYIDRCEDGQLRNKIQALNKWKLRCLNGCSFQDRLINRRNFIFPLYSWNSSVVKTKIFYRVNPIKQDIVAMYLKKMFVSAFVQNKLYLINNKNVL